MVLRMEEWKEELTIERLIGWMKKTEEGGKVFKYEWIFVHGYLSISAKGTQIAPND